MVNKCLSGLFFCLMMMQHCFAAQPDLLQELFDAINKNDVTKVTELITKNTALLTKQDSKGNTVLHVAVAKKRLTIVQTIMGFPTAKDALQITNNDDEQTPLDIAEELFEDPENEAIKGPLQEMINLLNPKEVALHGAGDAPEVRTLTATSGDESEEEEEGEEEEESEEEDKGDF